MNENHYFQFKFRFWSTIVKQFALRYRSVVCHVCLSCPVCLSCL